MPSEGMLEYKAVASNVTRIVLSVKLPKRLNKYKEICGVFNVSRNVY